MQITILHFILLFVSITLAIRKFKRDQYSIQNWSPGLKKRFLKLVERWNKITQSNKDDSQN